MEYGKDKINTIKAEGLHLAKERERTNVETEGKIYYGQPALTSWTPCVSSHMEYCAADSPERSCGALTVSGNLLGRHTAYQRQSGVAEASENSILRITGGACDRLEVPLSATCLEKRWCSVMVGGRSPMSGLVVIPATSENSSALKALTTRYGCTSCSRGKRLCPTAS